MNSHNKIFNQFIRSSYSAYCDILHTCTQPISLHFKLSNLQFSIESCWREYLASSILLHSQALSSLPNQNSISSTDLFPYSYNRFTVIFKFLLSPFYLSGQLLASFIHSRVYPTSYTAIFLNFYSDLSTPISSSTEYINFLISVLPSCFTNKPLFSEFSSPLPYALGSVTFVKEPLIHYLASNLSFKSLFIVLIQLLTYPSFLIRHHKSFPLTLLSHTFHYFLVQLLLQYLPHPPHIFLSTDFYTFQPPWLRLLPRSTISLFWHTNSLFPLVYKSDPTHCSHPYYTPSHISHHIVPSEAAGKFACQCLLGDDYILYDPSIISPNYSSLYANSSTVTISIFDEPCLTDNEALVSGCYPNAYSYHKLQSFYSDIFHSSQFASTSFGVDINILIKQKRSKPFFLGERLFNQYLLLLAQQYEFVQVLDSSTPSVDVIRSSNITISYPFASPSYISAKFGHVSIYYDPSSSLLKHTSFTNMPPLISGVHQLTNFLLQVVPNYL